MASTSPTHPETDTEPSHAVNRKPGQEQQPDTLSLGFSSPSGDASKAPRPSSTSSPTSNPSSQSHSSPSPSTSSRLSTPPSTSAGVAWSQDSGGAGRSQVIESTNANSIPDSNSNSYYNNNNSNIISPINHNTNTTPNANNAHSTDSALQKPTTLSDPVTPAQVVFGGRTRPEPESGSYPSFQSFFSPPSPQTDRVVSFEDMLMDDSAAPLPDPSATAGAGNYNYNGYMDHSRIEELISPRPRPNLRSLRNGRASQGGITNNENNAVGDSNNPISATSPDRFGSSVSDPSSIKTILSSAGYRPARPDATEEGQADEDSLDYRLKGRSHALRAYPADYNINNWTVPAATATASGGHSRRSTQDHRGATDSSHSHETQPTTINGCGVASNGQDHEEHDYLNQGKPVRNYKVFPGRNIFFCGGRVMTSRDFPAFFMATLMILVPTGLFHGFTSPYLWHRLSPAAPIVQAYIFIVAFSSMIKTSWTDPGVLPRGIDSDPPVDPPLDLDFTTASFYPPQPLPRIKEVQIGIYVVRLKYCDTCRIYRPPRCSHCRQCDNCVEDEDHHCIWLNNCIGRRNYRYFLIFVTTASMYAFLTSALSLTHLMLLYNDRRNEMDLTRKASFQADALAKAPVSALVMIYAFIMGLAVGALATYHFWLATMNRTTHEQLTASMMRPHPVDNPFDRGSIFGNCAAVFCRPPTRSYIRRRDYMTP